MPSIPKGLRRNPAFIELSKYLDQQGYRFTPVNHVPHPYVLVEVGLRAPIKFCFPGTTGDYRAAKNAVSDFKWLVNRRIEQAKRNAT